MKLAPIELTDEMAVEMQCAWVTAELYVTYADQVVLYNTEQEALEAAKIWNRYRVVYFSNYT